MRNLFIELNSLTTPYKISIMHNVGIFWANLKKSQSYIRVFLYSKVTSTQIQRHILYLMKH